MRSAFEKLLEDNEKEIEKLKARTEKIVIFGAGNTTELYVKCFEAEKINIEGVVDNNPAKINTEVLGKRVTPAGDIVRDYGNKVLVLISTAVDRTYKVLSEQVKSQGLLCCGADEYVLADHSADILDCFDSMEDDESKKIYQCIIAAHLTHKGKFPFPYMEQYFACPEFLVPNGGEVFVDAGAYVGDSVERYIFNRAGVFGKIYAFEPDMANFKAMEYRTERLQREWALTKDKIELVPYGVGKENIDMTVRNGDQGLGSKLVDSDDADGKAVRVVKLDDYFKEQKIDFLKADIESFEYDMLCGAEKIIRRDRPLLAICIYHNATDLYRILLWIKNLNLGYKFKVKHHSACQADTVLYAYQ